MELSALIRNYPRSRGEEIVAADSDFFPRELPPLARGRAPIAAHLDVKTGITPARAGKRKTGSTDSKNIWNYPRSRGEEVVWIPAVWLLWELPPLARGRVAEEALDVGD